MRRMKEKIVFSFKKKENVHLGTLARQTLHEKENGENTACDFEKNM